MQELHRRYISLALSFPVVHGCPGAPEALRNAEDDSAACQNLLGCLEAWLAENIEMAERQVALFLLNLWTRSTHWPPFHLFDALVSWDAAQTSAFQAWVLNPWRP